MNMNPVIVSASRRTDIPAFYAKWFANRIKAGYCMVGNNKIMFDNTLMVVFWTKNPEPMIQYLNELETRGIDYYFQYTLNDYDNRMEKSVPSLSKRIDTFKRLADMKGSERVIWRYDPIIITEDMDVNEHLRRIENIGNQLKGYTNKLVFSFFDNYGKATSNMIKAGVCNARSITQAVPNNTQMNELAKGIGEMAKKWGIKAATCAEAIDLKAYGIERNRCIGPELIDSIAGPRLKEYMNQFRNADGKIDMMKAKDKSQRRLCGCMASYDIGTYNTCLHQCAYCYANMTLDIAMQNRKKHDVNADSMISFTRI